MKGIRCFLLFLLLLNAYSATVSAKCVGRFLNPITDVFWKCVFPLTIAGIKVASGNPENTISPRPLCVCPKPPLNLPTPGIPVGFWEPARMVDVTRTPFCLLNLGGLQIANTGIRGRGDVDHQDDESRKSFYHVHWYIYPLLYWLEVLTDFLCLEDLPFDLSYLTELDPFWMDEEKSAILNPEGIIFGNIIAQAACAADCVSSSAHLPLDSLFWCGGCQGSLYPFTGSVTAHNGGVQGSLLLVSRMMAKLHRELLLWGTSGEKALCKRYPMPIILKSQYRTQMTYPVPQTSQCQTLGASEVLWQGAREYPVKGEDFGYLIWRQRNCCAI